MRVVEVMNCEQASNLFDAHLDGELSRSLETELAAHRLRCPQCRHELAVMEVAGHVIAASDDGSSGLDDAFTDRLLACVDAPVGAPGWGWQRALWLGGSSLAAAAAIAIVVTAIFSGPTPRVAGERVTNPSPAIQSNTMTINDPAFDAPTDSLVRQVESTWLSRADSAQSLLDSGQIILMGILDQFGAEPTSPVATGFEPLPDSFDELAPSVSSADDIEDL